MEDDINWAVVYALAQTVLSYIGKTLFMLFQAYLAFYILACCHEVLEDHREGTVNARSKSVDTLISLVMLVLTFMGIYGVFTLHFGLFVTWLILRPVVRIIEIESAFWTTIAMSVIASGWTACYWTYEHLNGYSSSLVV